MKFFDSLNPIEAVVAPASHLLPGVRIIVPTAKWAGATAKVVEVRDSQRGSDFLVCKVMSRQGVVETFILHVAEPVSRELTDARPAELEGPKKCHCRNHMGSAKVKYRSRDAAIRSLIHRHLNHGGHEIYECKTERGVFHIRSHKAKGV